MASYRLSETAYRPASFSKPKRKPNCNEKKTKNHCGKKKALRSIDAFG